MTRIFRTALPVGVCRQLSKYTLCGRLVSNLPPAKSQRRPAPYTCPACVAIGNRRRKIRASAGRRA